MKTSFILAFFPFLIIITIISISCQHEPVEFTGTDPEDIMPPLTDGGAVTRTAGNFQIPGNQAQLADCNITQLQKWIENGTPND